MLTPAPQITQGAVAPFPGGGQSGALVRSIDWAKTPLGPQPSWPPALTTLVRSLLHAPHALLLFWGPELIQLHNDACIPILGEKHPGAMGQRAQECWVEAWPVVGPQIQSALDAGASSQHLNLLVPIVRNGRLGDAWFNYSYSPAFDDKGGIGGVLVIVTETTVEVLRGRQVESARRNEVFARERLASMFQSAPAFLAMLRGPTLIFEFANESYRRVVNNRELIGKPVREAFPEVEGQGFFEVLEGVYATGEAYIGKEVPILLRAGPGAPEEQAFVTLTYDVTRDSSGTIIGLIVFGVDVTEAVVARRKVEELAAERAVLLEQEQKAGRARDEFLAMLGHELRNPLAPILTATQLMKMRGNEAVRERLVIERQVVHMSRLVDDLLDVSKIARGKIDLRLVSAEISGIVSHAIELASPLLEMRSQQLTVEVAEAGLGVRVDRVRMAQVITNLLTNAARYCPPHSHIALTAAREGGEVVVAVRDDGPGIALDLLPDLFEMFVQGKRSIDRAEGGLGLGLALVKNLVGLHGGSVSACNRPSGGSEFTVRLPAVVVEESPVAPETLAQTTAAAHPKQILVVDDNVDAASLVADLLRNLGHVVVVAHDGPGALEALRTFRADVGVLDLGLPVMDGFELARRCRNLSGGNAPLRLIALTGYGQVRDREESLRAGFDVHLSKPVKLDELTLAIEGAARACSR